jgi:D-3-phosphoglycerate dehydrogenase
MSFRVLIADKLDKQAVPILVDAGFEVVNKPGLSEDEIAAAIKGFDAVIVRSAAKITAKIIEAADCLKCIGRAGTGVDNIDVKAATAKGILVMNVPGGNTVTAAEHALVMMLSMARMVPQANASMKAGKWEKSSFTGYEITGKTLGVVGFGKIGQIVADRAMGLRMKVAAFDPVVPPFVIEAAGVTPVATVNELMAMSDFVSIHTPLNDKTRGLVGSEALAAAKNGVMVVNCARGGIVDEAALIEALNSGKVRSAAIDVWTSEPIAEGSVAATLAAMPNVVATPHLGASTHEAQNRVALSIARQIRDFLNSGAKFGAVN